MLGSIIRCVFIEFHEKYENPGICDLVKLIQISALCLV